MAFPNGSGGTLTLSSPSQVHPVDAAAASVRSLRRSLSRSPSRFHLLRSDSATSDSSSNSIQMPSPDSPCPAPHILPHAAMDASHNTHSNTTTSHHESSLSLSPSTTPVRSSSSLFATPLRSGMRLSLRSARPKTTSSKPLPRTRLSPRSPLKRALNASSDMGNAAPPTSSLAPPRTAPSTTVSEPILGQENGNGNTKFNSFLLGLSTPARSALEKPSRHSMHLDLSGEGRSDAVASPLKRSDSTMDFDQTTFGSPVAKRRSLHGISGFGSDFNVFDFASPNMETPNSMKSVPFEIHEDNTSNGNGNSNSNSNSSSSSNNNNREYQLSNANGSVSSPALPLAPPPAPTPTAMQKRSSSLRKSTLQQRHDPRSSWGRRQGEKYLAQQQQQQQQQQQTQSPQQPKRSTNEWLFTPHTRNNKPRASLDQLLRPEPRESPFKVKGPLPNPSMHTVERSTGSSLFGPGQRPHPLSRTLTTSSSSSSLPDDSPTHFPVQPPPDRPARPTSIFARSLPLNAHRPRPEPVATPQYKSARPLQSVFASAGLISKMNRSEDDGPHGPGHNLAMPDTPCKKQVYPSNTYPPSSGSGRKHQRKFLFSSAETPFNTGPSSTRGSHSESVVNFFKLRSSHSRQPSLLSMDGDNNDSQGTTDGFDLPPTPTKSVLAKNLFGSTSGTKGRVTPIALRDVNTGSASNPLGGSTGNTGNISNIGSFTPSTTPFVASTTPAGTPRASLTLPIPSPTESAGSDKVSPKTPRESTILPTLNTGSSNIVPPDASRLSISNGAQDNQRDRSSSSTTRPNSATFPPATPTADREAFASFIDRRVSITPVHAAPPNNDVDPVLSSMFGRVERIGKGEFSQVFRVASNRASRGSLDYFSTTPSKRPQGSLSLSTERVYAVKKIRLPLYGQKTRESKLREVTALEAFRNCENVLQIFDHWEQNGNLYIQTEYCDEGGLDGFLKKVGEHGRLDDFRIWKILLEMSQGLRYVHDAGFIHLDLKPANVLVTYEGHLKIGDFGMAAQWPAAKGIEGEGDREYIGPEILQGKYDKPADVFSLGLIVLEIACNVFLPDNGPIWVALREGDMSVVPSLTTGEANALARDSTGMPIVDDGDDGYSLAASLDLASSTAPRSPVFRFGHSRFGSGSVFDSLRKKPVGLQEPPDFMANQHHAGSLDSVVSWLINPDPASRPTVHQILELESLQWVHRRRRAPATIFEGNWGPEDNTFYQDATAATSTEVDTEMTDV